VFFISYIAFLSWQGHRFPSIMEKTIEKGVCAPMEDMTIRQLHLNLRSEHEMLADFLASHDLRLDPDVECAFGIFEEEELVGCGCAAGNLLKCFAIGQALRGRNGLGTLISRLSANRFMAGYPDLFVFTRPHNRELFMGCGFVPLAETDQVILLENNRSGLSNFLRSLPRPGGDVREIGAIVMNCNPLTNGHLTLIRHAAGQCEFLYIFVVEENRSTFPFADRIALVRAGTADLPNVCVCPSGPYMISGLTFPTYFLKDTESPSALQSEVDITLFARQIAPALGIRRRFAGEEPLDAVTRQYNETMQALLPAHGIEFCQIPRACLGDEPISASRVRALLAEHGGVTAQIREMVPPCTADYLLEKYGEAAR